MLKTSRRDQALTRYETLTLDLSEREGFWSRSARTHAEVVVLIWQVRKVWRWPELWICNHCYRHIAIATGLATIHNQKEQALWRCWRAKKQHNHANPINSTEYPNTVCRVSNRMRLLTAANNHCTQKHRTFITLTSGNCCYV